MEAPAVPLVWQQCHAIQPLPPTAHVLTPHALAAVALCVPSLPQPRRGCFEVRRQGKVYESLQVGAAAAGLASPVLLCQRMLLEISLLCSNRVWCAPHLLPTARLPARLPACPAVGPAPPQWVVTTATRSLCRAPSPSCVSWTSRHLQPRWQQTSSKPSRHTGMQPARLAPRLHGARGTLHQFKNIQESPGLSGRQQCSAAHDAQHGKVHQRRMLR